MLLKIFYPIEYSDDILLDIIALIVAMKCISQYGYKMLFLQIHRNSCLLASLQI